MLAPQTIMEAVKGLLGERFPGETVYTNLAPRDFVRPSFLLETSSVQMADASRDCLSVAVELALTAFVVVDEYHNSHLEALLGRMMAAQELFAVEGLRVGDRVLRVPGNAGKAFFDYAEVRLKLEYQDDRPGGLVWPLMEEFHLNCKEETGHGIT